jgi:hypothetical protein
MSGTTPEPEPASPPPRVPGPDEPSPLHPEAPGRDGSAAGGTGEPRENDEPQDGDEQRDGG